MDGVGQEVLISQTRVAIALRYSAIFVAFLHIGESPLAFGLVRGSLPGPHEQGLTFSDDGRPYPIFQQSIFYPYKST